MRFQRENRRRRKIGLQKGNGSRKSKDKSTNQVGKRLLKWTAENGMTIMNGNVEEDKEEAYTYVSSIEETVIDYVMVKKTAEEEIAKMGVGETTASDHMPLKIEIEMRQEKTPKQERRKKTIYK